MTNELKYAKVRATGRPVQGYRRPFTRYCAFVARKEGAPPYRHEDEVYPRRYATIQAWTQMVRTSTSA